MLATTDNVIVFEIWRKCRDRSEIVKCLSSHTLSLTLRTKSSFIKDGRPLHASSCTFSRPSLNIWTYFLIALLPYTWQILWWISLGSTFLAFKKRITDRISQSAAPTIVLDMFNAQNKHKHNTNFMNVICGFSIDRGSHCTCTKWQSRGCARDMRRWYLLSK